MKTSRGDAADVDARSRQAHARRYERATAASIPLASNDVTEVSDRRAMPHALEVSTPARSFYFRCASRRDQQEWHAALKDGVELATENEHRPRRPRFIRRSRRRRGRDADRAFAESRRCDVDNPLRRVAVAPRPLRSSSLDGSRRRRGRDADGPWRRRTRLRYFRTAEMMIADIALRRNEKEMAEDPQFPNFKANGGFAGMRREIERELARLETVDEPPPPPNDDGGF